MSESELAERMRDVEEIKRLKARYFRLMDTKDWEGFRAIFLTDVRIDVSGDGAGIFEGIDAFMDMLVPTLQDVVTVHHGHMPEIEVTSSATATGIWAMEDKLQFPAGSPLSALHGYGHYHDTYVKTDGSWRIASSRLTRLRVDIS
jgi:SnoaL-like domain